MRRTCESDLSLYHRALVSEDQKEASAELAMDETLSCVQSDIMAVHRHQMAMPKDESTSERAARCVVDARQHKGYVVTWLSAVEEYRKTGQIVCRDEWVFQIKKTIYVFLFYY